MPLCCAAHALALRRPEEAVPSAGGQEGRRAGGQEGSASVEGLRVYVVEGVCAERRRARPLLKG